MLLLSTADTELLAAQHADAGHARLAQDLAGRESRHCGEPACHLPCSAERPCPTPN